MTYENSSMPDTVIKLYEDHKNKNEHRSQLEELQTINETKPDGYLLHLRESLQGNIFNRPFQYILLRHLQDREKHSSQNVTDDDDPMSDYFVTLEKTQCHLKSKVNPLQEDETVVAMFEEKRYVILAYKVVDNNNESKLERNWRQWTGTTELLKGLAITYKILSVWCLKGVNVTPDIFKYVVIIELSIDKLNNQGDNYALDFLQKFRIKRMSGYVALYTPFTSDDIRTNLKLLSPTKIDQVPEEVKYRKLVMV